jgi:hypothetical protein
MNFDLFYNLKTHTPSSLIRKLCVITNTNISLNESLASLVDKTQKSWYQKGKERWEMKLSPK